MTDDIPALIERLQHAIKAYDTTFIIGGGSMRQLLQDCVEALSRLTVSPLPEEIADYLKFLRTYSSHPGITDAAAALERMAHENEELRTENAKAFARQIASEDHIKELEAERDAEKDRAELWKAANGPLYAIKAKTIEECAEVAEKYWAREVASQIRALNQPPKAEGKEE
jgi:hypothetical protein